MNRLIDQIRVGILFEDNSGRIVTVNHYFCDLFGIELTPDGLIGRDIGEVTGIINNLTVKPQSYVSFVKEIKAGDMILNGGEICLRDGRFIKCDYVPVKDNELLIGYLWQYTDITRDKLREKYDLLICDLGFKLISISTLDEALRVVLETVKKIDEIDGACIYLINPDTGLIELIMSSGLSGQFLEKEKKYDPSKYKFKLVQKGKSIFGSHSEIISRSPLFQHENLNQIGMIPIKDKKDHVIGSLNVGSVKSDEIGNDVKIALEMIASYIGGAITCIKNQNELLLSQKNFHLIFDVIDDLIFIFDVDGNIIETNPAAGKRLGYTAEELYGMNIYDIHSQRRRGEVKFLISEMLTGRIKMCCVPLYTKNNREIPVETKVFEGKWNSNDVLYCISRDISERIDAEKKLRKSEARLRYAMDSTGDGIWDWDMTTNKVFYSRHWKKMFGYGDEDISDTRHEWEKLIHPDDLEKMISNLESHIKGEIPSYRNVHRVICKDGTYKWVAERGKIISFDDSGIPERMIGTTADVSKMKEYENSLTKALHKEKELNELKSYFVSKTSHEFRTPLSIMLMAVETLENYFDKMSSEERKKKIRRIKSNIKFLTKVIEKVLDLSHLESGKVKFEPAKINLNEFLAEVIDEICSLPNTNHPIKLYIPDDPVYITIDKQMIRQVINNIISNSFKYSGKGSNVEVKLTNVKAEAVICFSDQGIGIPEKDNAKIFEPFFRGSNVGNIRGTGLGLALSKQFVNYHGGDITFYSPGKGGTVFSVTLPGIKD